MDTIHKIVIGLVLLAAVSCSPKSLGYFEVDPFFKPTTATVDEPLYLDLGSKVQDDYTLTQPGLRTLNVHFFKQSYRFALTHTFNDQFRSVEFMAGEPKGFVLKIYRFEPGWWVGEEKQVIRKEFNDTLRYRDFGCRVQYESTLFYNNEKVSEANGEIKVIRDFGSMQTIDEVFRNAVKLSCEDMAGKIAATKGQ
jgi:hypothetical protein